MDDQTPQTEQPRARDDNFPWIPGIILILVGVVLLVNNTTNFRLDNWWALFILIPALTAFARFWRRYQEDGRFNADARGSLIGGFVLLFIAAIFLFNLNFGALWPVFLILGGIALLINAILPS